MTISSTFTRSSTSPAIDDLPIWGKKKEPTVLYKPSTNIGEDDRTTKTDRSTRFSGPKLIFVEEKRAPIITTKRPATTDKPTTTFTKRPTDSSSRPVWKG